MTLTNDYEPETEAIDRAADQTERRKWPPRHAWRKRILIIIGVIGAVLAAVELGRFGLHARYYESTDDAFIEARIVPTSTKLAGYVETVAVEDNQHVKRGDLLVKLDARDQRAKLDQARAALLAAQSRLTEARTLLEALQANVEQARADLAARQASADLAHTDLQRIESMPPGAASLQERSNAISVAQAADANVVAARSRITAMEAGVTNGVSHVSTIEAEVAVAQTQVAQAELDLEYTTIVSPASGHVARRGVERGAYLQQGQAVMAIVPDDVWIVANFKETQLADMRPGQPVDIDIDAYPSRKFKGHVDSIQSGTGSRFSLLPPENATGNYVKVVQRVPVKIVFDEKLPEDLVLAPGMSVVPDVKVK